MPQTKAGIREAGTGHPPHCYLFPFFQSFRERQRRYSTGQSGRFHRGVPLRLGDAEMMQRRGKALDATDSPPKSCTSILRLLTAPPEDTDEALSQITENRKVETRKSLIF